MQALGISENGCVCNAIKVPCSGISSYGDAAGAADAALISLS